MNNDYYKYNNVVFRHVNTRADGQITGVTADGRTITVPPKCVLADVTTLEIREYTRARTESDRLLHQTFEDIILERANQVAKYGRQRNNDLVWLAIVTEQLGEVAKLVVDDSVCSNTIKPGQLEHSLVQTAAACCAWLQQLKDKKKHDDED